jgi:hypothetical protein
VPAKGTQTFKLIMIHSTAAFDSPAKHALRAFAGDGFVDLPSVQIPAGTRVAVEGSLPNFEGLRLRGACGRWDKVN